MTIKKEGDTRVYFAVVSNHFRENKEAVLRIEALGSAVTTAVRVVHILESCGIGQVCKVKCKEKTINYELENGRLSSRLTMHIKYDFVRCPSFGEASLQKPRVPIRSKRVDKWQQRDQAPGVQT